MDKLLDDNLIIYRIAEFDNILIVLNQKLQLEICTFKDTVQYYYYPNNCS
jgi:hypothetical protein